MRLLILFVVVFGISISTTQAQSNISFGNITYDHVSTSSNVVSKDNISITSRIMSPTEANTVFNGRFVRYDHYVRYDSKHGDKIYTPITDIQPCVLSILNNGNDTIIFKATDTNNYITRKEITEHLTVKDANGGALIFLGLLMVALIPAVPSTNLTGVPILAISGAVLTLSGIVIGSGNAQTKNQINQYLENISPDKLKIAPHQESQIVVFRLNPMSPNFSKPNLETFTESKPNNFIDKTQSDILRLNFLNENKKSLEIDIAVKS